MNDLTCENVELLKLLLGRFILPLIMAIIMFVFFSKRLQVHKDYVTDINHLITALKSKKKRISTALPYMHKSTISRLKKAKMWHAVKVVFNSNEPLEFVEPLENIIKKLSI